MLGCDVRNLTPENKALITNRALIEIAKDEEARPPMFVRSNNGWTDNTICFKHLTDGRYAIGFFNAYDKEISAMLPYYEIGLDPMCGYGFDVTNVFTGEREGIKKDYFEVSVPAGDCKIYTAELVKVK